MILAELLEPNANGSEPQILTTLRDLGAYYDELYRDLLKKYQIASVTVTMTSCAEFVRGVRKNCMKYRFLRLVNSGYVLFCMLNTISR